MNKSIKINPDLVWNNHSLTVLLIKLTNTQRTWENIPSNNEDLAYGYITRIAEEVDLCFEAEGIDNSFDHEFGREYLKSLGMVKDSMKLFYNGKWISNKELKEKLTHTVYDKLIDQCMTEINHWDGPYDEFGD